MTPDRSSILGRVREEGGASSGPGSTRSAPEAPAGLRPTGDDPSRDDAWHRIAASVGPILKAAFPEAHGVTRLQAAQAIATQLEHLARPRFGEPGYVPTPPPLHAYKPHRKWPWFCGECGYPEHERLKHPPRDSDGSPEGRDAQRLDAEHDSAGRQASPESGPNV